MVERLVANEKVASSTLVTRSSSEVFGAGARALEGKRPGRNIPASERFPKKEELRHTNESRVPPLGWISGAN